MVVTGCSDSRRLTAFAGPLATGLIALSISMALTWNITAWMHDLLSYSYKHPIPEGSQSEFGVVLGYALHKNGSCTQPLQSRVEVGVQLYEQGVVARLIFSGAHPGSGLRNVTEANAMTTYALTLVAQPPNIGRWLLEESSTSTRTNAVYSLDIIREQQQQQLQQQQQWRQHRAAGEEDQAAQQQQQHPATVVIVTNPFHQWRSYFTFKRAAQQAGMDMQLYIARAPFAGHCGYGHWLLDAAMDQVDFWRELAAIAWYGVRGWL